ncbi:type II toxin-antitoxin system prevent-host-death family antitoxin [Sporichthya sp.]|uniref:type II toxin-antitoxin system prevent-host-death family antitoxin n=1 Tax=Sporichthya sp. TaxID=65475 RepID=UPI00185C1248|nr:type II toxin-antitoxin system prevent-host-death family antitoxin [Sporichthya sp.]MBA3745672.1 type II toxin-antitoxin system prevent-host-death family antitoxin [Sporichthya sp.]
METHLTSREFNQDTSGAKRAAERGPVIITDRGEPAHVLLTYAAYAALSPSGGLLALLGHPAGVAEVEFEAPRSRELPTPASFD